MVVSVLIWFAIVLVQRSGGTAVSLHVLQSVHIQWVDGFNIMPVQSLYAQQLLQDTCMHSLGFAKHCGNSFDAMSSGKHARGSNCDWYGGACAVLQGHDRS